MSNIKFFYLGDMPWLFHKYGKKDLEWRCHSKYKIDNNGKKHLNPIWINFTS